MRNSKRNDVSWKEQQSAAKEKNAAQPSLKREVKALVMEAKARHAHRHNQQQAVDSAPTSGGENNTDAATAQQPASDGANKDTNHHSTKQPSPWRKALTDMNAHGGKGLLAGDRAPDFELCDANGKRVKLYEKLSEGNAVVLVFFRGM